jgi:hypothetical protein
MALSGLVLNGLEARALLAALYDALPHWGYGVAVFNPLKIHAFLKSGLRACDAMKSAGCSMPTGL